MNFTVTENVLRLGLEAGAYTCCAILVGTRDAVLYETALGQLAPDDSTPADADTRFDMASCTKLMVTAMLTLQSLESGRLCLWDRLGTFVDGPADKQELTIRQLLTHTAGFSTGLHLWRLARDAEHATEILLNTPLQFAPGTRVQYCCAGYILLGQLLENLYGEPLNALAERLIFGPLGMRATGYRPEGGNIAATERQPDGACLRGVVHDENARFLGGVSGNAGVFSSLRDMGRFCSMLAREGEAPDGGRILAPATLRAAMRNHTTGLAQARGLGFYLPYWDDGYTGDLFPPETVGHTGFTGASLVLDPSSGLHVALLTNRCCPSRENLMIYRIRRLVHNTVFATVNGDSASIAGGLGK